MANEPLTAALMKMHRAELGTLPTPLHRLVHTERALGYEQIYIKRDDLTGLGPGGNKIRSLEYLLGDAMARGKRTILASGPEQSNLCTLTAAACAKLGLRCVLVHNGAAPEHASGNRLLNRLLGVESHFAGEGGKAARDACVAEVFAACETRGEAPYIIQNGATSGLGALGYANAARELSVQCEAFAPGIKTIFAPGGNGGVAAGLVYGNALLGLPFRVIIVSVEDTADVLRANIARTLAEAERLLGLPVGRPLEELCEITDAYRGGGWGEDTPESRAEVEDFARAEGIFIENVYNSKVLVGLKDYLRAGRVQGGVCYLHTGGFGSLFSQY